VATQKSDIAIYLVLSMWCMHVSSLVAAQKSDVAICLVHSALVAAQNKKYDTSSSPARARKALSQVGTSAAFESGTSAGSTCCRLLFHGCSKQEMGYTLLFKYPMIGLERPYLRWGH
jgi:hypothetical protein